MAYYEEDRIPYDAPEEEIKYHEDVRVTRREQDRGDINPVECDAASH